MSRHNLSCSISDSTSLHLVPSLSPSLESQTKKQEDKSPKLIFESRRCEHCGIITTTEDEVIIDIGINFGFRRGKCLRHYQGGMCRFVGDAGSIADHEMKGIEFMYVSHCQHVLSDWEKHHHSQLLPRKRLRFHWCVETAGEGIRGNIWNHDADQSIRSQTKSKTAKRENAARRGAQGINPTATFESQS